MSRKHRRRGGRVTPKGTQPRARPRHHGDDEPDLMRDIRQMVAGGHPADLLSGASQLIEAATQRPADRFGGRPWHGPSLATVVDSFVGVDRPETTAMLAALAVLLPDELLAARCRREVANRPPAGPSWINELADIEPTGVMEMTHILGDGDNVIIGYRWPSGRGMTAVVYIDHNVGQLVKDAFVIAEGLDVAVATFEKVLADEQGGETTLRPLDPADARARVTDAIAKSEITVPPFTSDSWPACRSVIEWLVRRLPEGGRGYQRREWSEREQDELVDEFFASAAAAGLRDDEVHRDAAENLVWFGCDYGPGDPLRWSPVSVEIVLVDWYPRKVVAPSRRLAVLPEVLRAFVRFAHQTRGIPVHLTEQTLAAVDLYDPEYQRLIRTPRPQGAEAIARVLIEAGHEDADDDDDEELTNADYAAIALGSLADKVGGHDVLDRLDTEPLPDEAFEWNGVDEDLRPRLEAVLRLADQCCDELLDHEYRTIARRLLARAARNSPGVIRRSTRDDKTAAALIWLAGKPNALFEPYGKGILVKDLLSWFGLTGSVSQRGCDLGNAAGLPGASSYDIRVGEPALLHSRQRARIIERRDRYRSY